MAKPGGPPRPTKLPADCPKDAAYIHVAGSEGVSMHLPSTDFPLVFEGGDGNDKVILDKSASKGVLVFGGRGNDSLIVESGWAKFADRIEPASAVFLVTLALALTLVGAIVWRASGPPRP
jgi:hypothetical protein